MRSYVGDVVSSVLVAFVTTLEPVHKNHELAGSPRPKTKRGGKEEWLKSRGYKDSFANDDEICPDPREDAFIMD
jgi:hypothetical protein